MASEKTYPTKGHLKPPSKLPSKTPESHFFKTSFKTTPIPNLTAPITSLAFSPAHPHPFAATYALSLSLFNPHHPFTPHLPTSSIRSFKDSSFSASFRSDGLLLAAASLSGKLHVFETKTRNPLRTLVGHTRPVRVSKYPHCDRLHLFSGGDDGVVKYWDVSTGACVGDFLGHKDYVRGGSVSPVDDNLFVSGSYDHTVRLWDVRGGNADSVMVVNHGKPVEDVLFLPGGGLVATAGGNVVKIWDVIGGGKCVGTMESHNKTVTAMCVGRVGRGRGGGEERDDEYRLLSVGLDGYMKVFDYAKMKVTFSMRFPAPLMSVAFSPDCSTRVIGTANGTIYMSKRKKVKVEEEEEIGGRGLVGFGYREEPKRRVLKPSFFRYFHRGQSEKPREGDYLVLRPKRVKLAEHDKLLKKFRHKDAFVAVLRKKNPENVVAVMEELVARRKLLKSVSNLDIEELELLLVFLQKYTTVPRFAGLLMPFANRVIQMRAEDIRASDALKVQIKNFKRSIQEELRIQQSLLEIQGVISPLMRIAGRR